MADETNNSEGSIDMKSDESDISLPPNLANVEIDNIRDRIDENAHLEEERLMVEQYP